MLFRKPISSDVKPCAAAFEQRPIACMKSILAAYP
jgi:hypothetical protein